MHQMRLAIVSNHPLIFIAESTEFPEPEHGLFAPQVVQNTFHVLQLLCQMMLLYPSFKLVLHDDSGHPSSNLAIFKRLHLPNLTIFAQHGKDLRSKIINVLLLKKQKVLLLLKPFSSVILQRNHNCQSQMVKINLSGILFLLILLLPIFGVSLKDFEMIGL